MLMKGLLQKRMMKIGIAIIILAATIGVISIHVHGIQRQKKYDSHVEAAEKYLTELDYEQAIVEYTLALKIEPKNKETMDALERIYLDYTQSLVDAGDYEKAVRVLEEGYAQTRRESLREKLEELRAIQERMVEFPFELADITINGYNLFDDHLEAICEAYGAPMEPVEWALPGSFSSYVDNAYGQVSGICWSDGQKEFHIYKYENNSHPIFYHISDFYGTEAELAIGLDLSLLSTERTFDSELYKLNVPVKPGDSQEDWNRIMQVREIKEKGSGGVLEPTYESYNFQTKWGRGEYVEWPEEDGTTDAMLMIYLDEKTVGNVGYEDIFEIAWYDNAPEHGVRYTYAKNRVSP